MAMGDICKKHSEEGVECYPEETPEEFVGKYVNDTDGRQAEFAGFQRVKETQEESQPARMDFSRCDVGSKVRTICRIKTEGVLAECSAFHKEAGGSVESVPQVPIVAWPDFDGDGPKRFGVFPDDGSASVQGLRKCELFTDIEIYMDEKVLEKDHHYREGQAADEYGLLRAAELKKRPQALMPSTKFGCKPTGLMSYNEAVAKAEAVRAQKMEAAERKQQRLQQGNEQSDDGEEKEEESEVVNTNRRRRSSFMESMQENGKGKRKAAAKKTPTKPKADNAKKPNPKKQDKDDDCDSEDDGEDSDDTCNSVDTKVSGGTAFSRTSMRSARDSNEKKDKDGDGVKVLSKAEQQSKKWSEKMDNHERIMRKGNLGRSINQAR